MPFLVEAIGSKTGWLILRNLSAGLFLAEDKHELLGLVTRHEVHHLWQKLLGRYNALYTDRDAELCKGETDYVSPMAAAGQLDAGYALALGHRFFRQKIVNELDAYGNTDFIYYAAQNGGSDLEDRCVDMVLMLIRVPLWCIGCSFLDTYRIPWPSWADPMVDWMEGIEPCSFLGQLRATDGHIILPSEILRNIELAEGLVFNRGLPSEIFLKLVDFLPHDADFAVYNPKAEPGRRIMQQTGWAPSGDWRKPHPTNSCIP